MNLILLSLSTLIFLTSFYKLVEYDTNIFLLIALIFGSVVITWIAKEGL